VGCSDSELAASRTDGELILQGELGDRVVTSPVVSVRLVSSNTLRLPSEGESGHSARGARIIGNRSFGF